jgi:hypothetical protein
MTPPSASTPSGNEALHQEPVGATDVEKGSVAVYGGGDGTPGPFPMFRVPPKARTAARVFGFQVRAFEQPSDLGVVGFVFWHAARRTGARDHRETS